MPKSSLVLFNEHCVIFVHVDCVPMDGPVLKLSDIDNQPDRTLSPVSEVSSERGSKSVHVVELAGWPRDSMEALLGSCTLALSNPRSVSGTWQGE